MRHHLQHLQVVARGTLAARVSSGLEEKYGFDSFDRAVCNGETRFAYDGLDRLSARNGKNFTYAGNSLDLVSDSDAKYSRGADGSLVALGQGDQKRLTVSDGHGDLVGGFDPAGSLRSLTDSAAFDPFGQAIASAGSKRSLGFQGDYTDPASGEVDMGARWYSPGTGGFTARDSVTLSPSPSGLSNRYAYGLGAPTNYDDPDGHCPICVVVGAVIVIGGGMAAVDYFTGQNGGEPQQSWCSNGCSGGGFDSGGGSNDSFGGSAVPDQGTKPGKNNTGGVGGYRPGPSPTQVARDAAASAARNNPLPQVPAATQPMYAGTVDNSYEPPVSSSPSLPAKVTQQWVEESLGSLVYQVMTDALQGKNPIDNVRPPTLSELSELWQFMHEPERYMEWVLDTSLQMTHLLLDVAGFIPGFGEVADGVNALIYLMEGDWENAGLAGFSMIPFVGWAGTGLKWAAKQSPEVTEWLAKIFKNCDNSFVADTKVLMADGSQKSIQDVQVGDQVIAADPTTGEVGIRSVTELISTDMEHVLVAITLDVDRDRGDKTAVITATDGHPFWADREWKAAADLIVGDEVETTGQGELRVVATERRTEVSRVYNFTVDGLHTYYVFAGDSPVLVHNQGAPPLGPNADKIFYGDYSYRLDRVPHSQQFEIHVYYQGNEVAFFGSSGWFNKHGHKGSEEIKPEHLREVERSLKGIAVKYMRNSGLLKEGDSVRGDNWKRSRCLK